MYAINHFNTDLILLLLPPVTFLVLHKRNRIHEAQPQLNSIRLEHILREIFFFVNT